MIFASALILWVLSVGFLDRLVPRQFDMALWSASLLCSLAIPAFLVARTERFRPRILHICLAAMASIGAYAWLEGRASNAGGSLHAASFYVTALLVPILLIGVTALTPRNSKLTARDG